MSSLGQRSITVFLGQWGSNAVVMVSSIVVARVLGPHEVGRMAFFLGTIGLFFMITSLGFAQAHQKRMAEGADFADGLSTYASVIGGLNALAVLAAVAAYPLLRGAFEGPGAGLLYGLFLAYLSLMNLNQIFLNTFYGRQEFAKSAVVLFGSRLVRLVAVCTLLIARPRLETLAVCLLIEAAAHMLLGTALSGAIRVLKRPSASVIASYWKYARPLALISPLNIAVENADRVVLGARFPAAELGFYNVAINLFEAVKSLPSAIITTLFPRLSRDFSSVGAAEAGRGFFSAHRKLMLMAAPVAISGAIWSRDIVRLVYGPAFAPAGPVLSIFFALFWFASFASPFHYILYAAERHRAFLWISPVANAFFALALWILCMPRWGLGAVGAVLAFAVPHLVSFPAVLWRVLRDCGIRVPAKTTAHALIAATMILFSIWIATRSASWVERALWNAGLVALYGVLMKVIGELHGDDLRYVGHVLNPATFATYFRSEFARPAK